MHDEPDARGRRRRRRRTSTFERAVRGALLVVLGGVFAAAAIFAFAWLSGIERGSLLASSEPGPALANAQPAAAMPAPLSVPEGSLIGKQAEAWGIKQCLAQVVAVSDALTRDAEYAYRLVRGETQADAEMLSGTVVVNIAAEGVSGLGRFHVAPIVAGGCNAAYQTVVHYAEPCSQTWANRFSAFSQRLDFGGDIAAAFATPEGNAGLYLLPAGDVGCVAVRTESLY